QKIRRIRVGTNPFARILFVQNVLMAERADADVVTQVSADPEAGLGARNVVVAGAVDVADADVFGGLGFSDDDRVGGAGAGYCDQGRSGAEKKALDVHLCSPVQN